MKISDKGLDLIKEFESFQADAYLCPAGVWTIGFGRTKGVKKGDKTTLEAELEKIKQDIKEYEEAVERLVTVWINQNQFDALVCFAYNVGIGALQSSTLLKKVNLKDNLAAADAFLMWDKITDAKTGKKVSLRGLTRRRQAERSLFLEKI